MSHEPLHPLNLFQSLQHQTALFCVVEMVRPPIACGSLDIIVLSCSWVLRRFWPQAVGLVLFHYFDLKFVTFSRSKGHKYWFLSGLWDISVPIPTVLMSHRPPTTTIYVPKMWVPDSRHVSESECFESTQTFIQMPPTRNDMYTSLLCHDRTIRSGRQLPSSSL